MDTHPVTGQLSLLLPTILGRPTRPGKLVTPTRRGRSKERPLSFISSKIVVVQPLVAEIPV